MNGVYCKDCRRFDRDLQCCKVTSESKVGAKERECDQFRKRFISNGDRIRAMSNEEEGNMAHVELKSGKYCNECCFGDVEEGLGGTVQCLKQDKKKCKPGKTVYKEIHNLSAVTNADKIRDMTDEELATFLVLNALQREHWDCDKELEWLRLEAKEEE